MLKHAKEYYQEHLELYEELYKDALDTVERKQTNWNFIRRPTMVLNLI